jgi:hypothetical protein
MDQMLEIKAKNLVEIGGIRWETGKQGDGHSTIAWGEYAKEHGLKIYSVDIDLACTTVCKKLTTEYSKFISYHTESGDNFLSRFSETIDVLYLDAIGSRVNGEGSDNYEEENLVTAKLAFTKMSAISLVLFDDIVSSTFEGKGKKAIPYFLDNGFRLLFNEERQVLLRRG